MATPGEQDDIWLRLKQGLLSATEKTFERIKKGIWRKQTWWWNEKVSKDISEMRRLWKLWKAGGSKNKYVDAKWKARHAIYTVTRNAKKQKFASVKYNKENIFPVAKQMRTENQDVIREKCIRGDDGNLSLDDAPNKLAWKQHYERLLNIEFQWSQNLPHVDPVADPAQFITPNDVLKSLTRMENGKVAGPSIIADLMNAIIREGKVPAD